MTGMIRILKALHLYGIWTVVGMFFVNHLFAGTRFFSIKRKLLRSMGHQIGNDTKVVAPLTTTVKLKIGDNCWIGREFAAYGNGTVTIGNCCDIAPRVSFHTGGHEFGTSERRAGIGRIYHITVGDGCWLGGGSTIVGTTTVGRGCMVAACACVVKDTEDNVLLGGVPAKVIRKFDIVSET